MLPDIGQLGLAAVEEAVAASHHVGGAVVEGGEHPVETGAFLRVEYHFVRAGGGFAGDQVAERGVAVGFDGRVEGYVVAGVADQVDDLLLGQVQFIGDLADLGFAAQGAF